MKKLVLFLLLSITINAQSWNSIITTSINTSNIDYVENFANEDGIHVVTYDDLNNDIKYYLLNTSGTTIRSSTISTNAKYPNIVGDQNTVYIVYKEGSYLKGKYTTDAGVNWTNTASENIGSDDCTGVDAAFDENKAHVVWSIGSNDEYETKYKNISTTGWADYKLVTDYSGGYGRFPTVSVSPDRIHVGFNEAQDDDELYSDDEMTRTKYNSTWQTQQEVYSDNSCRGKVFAGSSKLYDFYYKFEGGMGQVRTDLYYKNRNYGSTSWSSATLIEQASDVYELLTTIEKDNGTLHLFTPYGDVDEYIITSGTLSGPTTISSNASTILSLSANSVTNDIYLNWVETNSSYLKLRQYDDDPKTPENFSKTTSNNAPKVTWSYSNEPDIQHYEVWRRWVEGQYDSGWQLKATTTSNNYTDTGFIIGGKPYMGTVYYKIRAKDNSGNLSSYTSTMYFNYSGTTWKVAGEEETDSEISSYELFSNYPNPFNPTTRISYQIPNDGFVNLIVYNSLGQEVAVLVNQQQSIGRYTVQFNASNLPSGIYIYKLQAGEFSKVNKMLLVR